MILGIISITPYRIVAIIEPTGTNLHVFTHELSDIHSQQARIGQLLFAHFLGLVAGYGSCLHTRLASCSASTRSSKYKIAYSLLLLSPACISAGSMQKRARSLINRRRDAFDDAACGVVQYRTVKALQKSEHAAVYRPVPRDPYSRQPWVRLTALFKMRSEGKTDRIKLGSYRWASRRDYTRPSKMRENAKRASPAPCKD